MNTLVIDTSTKIELIAVSKDDKVYTYADINKKSHSITLFENLDLLLKKSKLKISDIELIGVGTGPGSFTGIRIAVSTARMLAQINKAPLVGINSHLIYANSIKGPPEENILVAFDAKKGRVFGALYKITGKLNIVEEIVTPGDYPINFLLEKTDPGKLTHFIGDGAGKYIKDINACMKPYKFYQDFLPSGEAAVRVILSTYKKDIKKYSNFNKIVPNYARKSDAEIAMVKK